MNAVGSRREEVLMHAARVIVRDGLEGTSLRRIAREGGYSTGVLTHYFVDKSELISACFEWTARRWLDRVESDIRYAPTAEQSLCRFVAAALPDAPGPHGEWRLWLNFVVAAARDASLAELLVAADWRWEAIAVDSVARWRAGGLIAPTISDDQQAVILTRLSDGLGLRALATGDWDEGRAMLVEALRAIGLSDELADLALLSSRAESEAV